MDYYCYLIKCDNRTYIGITNNLENRLDKHNKGLGAKATRCKSDWKFDTIVGMFDKSQALRFEWYWKHTYNNNNKWIRTKSGLDNKYNRLTELLKLEEWNDKNKLN